MIKNYFSSKKNFQGEYRQWANTLKGYINLNCEWNEEVFEKYVMKHRKGINRVKNIWRGLWFQRVLNLLLEGKKLPIFKHIQEKLIAAEAEEFYNAFSLRNDWVLIESNYQIFSWREARTIDYIFYSKFDDEFKVVNLKRSPYISEKKYKSGSSNNISQLMFYESAMKEHFKAESEKMVYYTITTYNGIYEIWDIADLQKKLNGQQYYKWAEKDF